jgi:geranylgeranyl pyrophosphate synthase
LFDVDIHDDVVHSRVKRRKRAARWFAQAAAIAAQRAAIVRQSAQLRQLKRSQFTPIHCAS